METTPTNHDEEPQLVVQAEEAAPKWIKSGLSNCIEYARRKGGWWARPVIAICQHISWTVDLLVVLYGLGVVIVLCTSYYTTKIAASTSPYDLTWGDWIIAFGIFCVFVRLLWLGDRQKHLSELKSILRDTIALRVERATDKHPTYRWLADEFRSDNCTASSNPLRSLKAMLSDVSDYSDGLSKQVSVHYQKSKGDGQAADYFCVIYAHKNTHFLKQAKFHVQVDYYRAWDCRLNPHDHVRRVFSVPVTFGPVTKLPLWPNDFDVGARQRLFLLLWLNSAFGISTTLHLFAPASKPDFFEAADYVYCHDPTNSDRGGDILWIAKPGNETECVEVTRAPLLATYFHYEFYKRVGGGHDKHHDTDVMYNVLRYNMDALLRHLGLEKGMAPDMKSVLIKSIEELQKGETMWTGADKNRIDNRWDRWFPPTSR